VGLAYDEFKIYRASGGSYKFELTDESESLSDCSLRDGMNVVVEKGRPLRKGEMNLQFELFDPTKDVGALVELFEMPVHEDTLVSDLKVAVANKLLQDKSISVDLVRLRLRDLSGGMHSTRRVGKVFIDSFPIKRAVQLYGGKTIGVQILPEAEPVTDEKDLVFFSQHFKPSSFEITPKEEVVINQDSTVDDLKAMLAKKYNIEVANLGLAKVDSFWSFYDDPDLLDVPNLSTWDKADRSTSSYYYYNSKKDNSVYEVLYLRNGGLVIVRDNSEKLKDLSKEEREHIEKEQAAKKKLSSGTTNYYYMQRKEKALTIHTSAD